MSVGVAYISEVDKAICILNEVCCPEIAIFHCVLSYPTFPGDANLCVIEMLKKYLNIKIGFCDHVTLDNTMMTLATAYLLGADIIEKHFTLDTLMGR